MNSIHKKLSTLSQSLVKLGHDEDAKAIKEALKTSGVEPTNSGFSFSVPSEIALEVDSFLKEVLGINPRMIKEDDELTPEEREEYNRLTSQERREIDIANKNKKDFETINHAEAALEKASLYGFGGKCAEAAIAINDVLFNEEGRLVAAVNKWLWEEEGRMVGHVAVEWKGSYWDSEGRKEWERIESWGMLDEHDEDYDFGDNPEQNATDVEKIYPSKEKLLEYFGGCDLSSLVRALEVADKEVREGGLGK